MSFDTETLGEKPDFVGRTGDLDLDGDGIPDLTQLRQELFIPSSGFVNDMNNDFITNLGRRKKFIFPDDSQDIDQVKLLQTARANFRKELNKYNTSFQDNIAQRGQSLRGSAPNQKTLREFLFDQTGREPQVQQEKNTRRENRESGEGFIETSSGKTIRVPKSGNKGI